MNKSFDLIIAASTFKKIFQDNFKLYKPNIMKYYKNKTFLNLFYVNQESNKMIYTLLYNIENQKINNIQKSIFKNRLYRIFSNYLTDEKFNKLVNKIIIKKYSDSKILSKIFNKSYDISNNKLNNILDVNLKTQGLIIYRNIFSNICHKKRCNINIKKILNFDSYNCNVIKEIASHFKLDNKNLYCCYLNKNNNIEDIKFKKYIEDKKMPYEDKTFDCIIIRSKLHFIKNIDFLLNEFGRILTRKGILYIEEYSAINDFDYLICDIYNKFNNNKNNWSKYYDKFELREIIENNNFKFIKSNNIFNNFNNFLPTNTYWSLFYNTKYIKQKDFVFDKISTSEKVQKEDKIKELDKVKKEDIVENILELYIINNKYIYTIGTINGIKTKLFSYYNEIVNKNNFCNIYIFNDLLKIFLYKYIKNNNNKNIIKLTIKFKFNNFNIIYEEKVKIKLNKNKYLDVKNIENNEYSQYLDEMKKIKLIKKIGINLKDKKYTNDINKIMKNIDFGDSLNFVTPYKLNIKNKISGGYKNKNLDNIKKETHDIKDITYPYLKDIITKNKLEERIENLKKHENRIIYLKKYILICFINIERWNSRYDITSYYNENKDYINYWNSNKDNIIKYCKLINNNTESINLRNELYLEYNYKNLLYYEETILNLVELYKSKSVLDIYLTTPKRLTACCIKNIKYSTIGTDIQKKEYNYFIINYGSRKQKIYKSLDKIKNKIEKNNKKYDIVFIDTESNHYKTDNHKQFEDLWNNCVSENGVLIYMYYYKKIDNYKWDIKEEIRYNKQIFVVYRKKEKVIDNTKKTYMILSQYLPKKVFRKYFPSDWKEIDYYTENIDFVYRNLYYVSILNKNLKNYKTQYLSTVKYIKHNFDDKDYLHKFVAKDNPKIFKKYFIEQYEIDKKNIDKYSKLFDKHKLWIVKPIPGRIGFGIEIFDNFNKLKEYILNFKLKWQGDKEVKKWVIQKYINNPLLIEGKKFHIRFNFINGIFDGNKFSKLIKFYEMIIAKKKYNKNNFEDKDIHDTHIYGREELSKDFIKKFKKEYGKEKLEYILKKIKKIHKYLAKIIKFKCTENSKNCYKIIGGDIIITDKFKVKCIELNMAPGLLLNNKKSSEIIIKTILNNMKII